MFMLLPLFEEQKIEFAYQTILDADLLLFLIDVLATQGNLPDQFTGLKSLVKAMPFRARL